MRWLLLGLALLLEACATRSANPPITQVNPQGGYRYETRATHLKSSENLIVLAFSGGGTRAAAFSYGVLEVLRDTEVLKSNGERVRMLDSVDIITGVSGGSFTALAYGLYGDRLFDDYETRFLKRDVQGELIRRALNPAHWGALLSTGWGRSELAAQLYDEILFKGATYADLESQGRPFIIVNATDISTGARFPLIQNTFDILCSDLRALPLARAAAASAAAPVLLSPVALNNYGGTCRYAIPPWLQPFVDAPGAARPAARALRHLQETLSFEDSKRRPFIHLVDGGVADNLAMRGVLESLETLEALRLIGRPTPLDRVRRVVVLTVNSVSTPRSNWDRSENPPGAVDILIKAIGVPIDHNSYEAVELLKDIAARWQTMQRLRRSAALSGISDPMVADALNVPEIEIYAIDVSFARLGDQAERDYLNELPTSLALPGEAVDRLRAAAKAIVLGSPDFQRLLKDERATIVGQERPGDEPRRIQ